MAETDLTLQQAAGLLGVHYMTAYRYVRLGVLPAHKRDGIWHVEANDLERVHAHRPAATRGPRGSKRTAPWAARLEARLAAGDARGAWGVIEAAMSAGAGVDEVYVDIISPAMSAIGDRWQSGDLDVADEHRATGIVFRMVGRLGPRFVRRGRTRGAVVLGTPCGERHALPVAMLADLIRMNGWEVSDLGADVPVASFVHAVTAIPDLVAVGISVVDHTSLSAATELIAALRSSDGWDARNVLLVVGGRAVRDHAVGASLGADAVALDASAFSALLDETRQPVGG